jgi:hypothetical protein
MPTDELVYAYLGGLTKSLNDDGTVNIRALATDETLDLDGQIADKEWAHAEMSEWFKTGPNVRAMHQLNAVGRGFELENADSGSWFKAKIVDADAILKLNNDIYCGASIGVKGAKVIKDKDAPNGRIVGGKIIEVSLVDRPANPSCRVEVMKAAGMTQDSVTTEPAVDGCPPCPTCDGTGKANDGVADCMDCNGSGESANNTYPSLNGGNMEDGQVGKAAECKTCKGTGKIKDGHMDCPDCTQKAANYQTDYFGYTDEDKAAWTPFQKSLYPDSVKKDYSDKDRKRMSTNGQAMPGGGFPIANVQDLKNAIQAIGRAKDPTAAKAHIKTRAKALGQEALIPDSWKSVTVKTVETVCKAIQGELIKAQGDDDTMKHDPDQLGAVRDGIIAIFKDELDELGDGENELDDISQLGDVLSTFLSWWQGEYYGGEVTSPFTGGDSMSFVGLGVEPDLIKAVQSDAATDEQKNEFKAEVRKALGLDEIDTLKATQEKILADLEGVKKMAAPRGISLRATQFQQGRFAEVEALTAQADNFKSVSLQSTDPETKRQYMEESIKTRAKADEIRKSLEGDN